MVCFFPLKNSKSKVAWYIVRCRPFIRFPADFRSIVSSFLWVWNYRQKQLFWQVFYSPSFLSRQGSCLSKDWNWWLGNNVWNQRGNRARGTNNRGTITIISLLLYDCSHHNVKFKNPSVKFSTCKFQFFKIYINNVMVFLFV